MFLPPPFQMTIEQVVGYCEGNTSRTSSFITTPTSEDGRTLERRAFRSGPEGSPMEKPRTVARQRRSGGGPLARGC